MQTDHANVYKMASDLLTLADVDFNDSTKLTQSLVATFLFGMLHAHGALTRMIPTDVVGLATEVFIKVLNYTPEAAAEGVQNCIDATAPGVHETMNAIMHRGIDGHRQYQADDIAGLRQNMRSILEHFRHRA